MSREKAEKPAQPDAPSPKLDERLQHLQREIEQSKERYLRALADFDNAKKRLEREKDEFSKYASQTIVRELLPIVDSLDQAVEAVDQQADPQAIIKGVHLIHRQLLGLLEKEGVKRIPTVGEPFDPHRHEAVAQIEAKDGVADNTVMEQVQVGYILHGKVLRPAMVKVAKKAAHSTQHTADSTDQGHDQGTQQTGEANG